MGLEGWNVAAPFLIMKDEGEIWQFVGSAARQCTSVINILAKSIANPAVGDQPSWAHVVKGDVSVITSPPSPPPRVDANSQVFRNPVKATSEMLIAAKAAQKVVPNVTKYLEQKLELKHLLLMLTTLMSTDICVNGWSNDPIQRAQTGSGTAIGAIYNLIYNFYYNEA